MPKEMFIHLNPEKKAHLEAALMIVFSKENLLTVSVKDIVEEAGIPRGSFYTYFDDLIDAYRHVLGLVLKNVHEEFAHKDVYEQSKAFIEGLAENPNRQFLKQYYLVNEPILAAQEDQPIDHDEKKLTDWLSSMAIHQLICDCFRDEKSKSSVLNRLNELESYFEGK
ncbi:helix-turn-helix transcriptional regulator [Fructobacillus sp. M2-14]|uniref:Helix-turn-helix transcriptional regulator n=1 Tax=Fructobacillus broussonetiae TaxID=2713173 RepID=A0ABS5R152_9LACO|nr:helix-turn-helix domain-containing protein [Fructobacillus broussonetiae]MBS9339174.1 helix-turn-helix transcriptional regulator [Fructobacillus broussonetiae]